MFLFVLESKEKKVDMEEVRGTRRARGNPQNAVFMKVPICAPFHSRFLHKKRLFDAENKVESNDLSSDA